MNIVIVSAFIALRKIAKQYHEIIESLEQLKDRRGGYDAQLNQIYEALETDKKVEEENKLEKWITREKIGVKKQELFMTKKYFVELADYNVWANNIVCGWLEKITDEQWDQTIISSFNSIQETILHMIGAEHVWAERINGVAAPVWVPDTFKGTKDEHIALLKKTSQALKTFVTAFDENKLQTKLFFKRINGEENLMPFYQILAHVFNHSSYHRGQLVTMLRQVGFTTVGSTDLSLFYKQMNSAE